MVQLIEWIALSSGSKKFCHCRAAKTQKFGQTLLLSFSITNTDVTEDRIILSVGGLLIVMLGVILKFLIKQTGCSVLLLLLVINIKINCIIVFEL